MRSEEACRTLRRVLCEKNGQTNLSLGLAKRFKNAYMVCLSCCFGGVTSRTDSLLALDHVSPYNWLDDNFWLNKAYLEWRSPLLVNSNWWLAFFDDPLIPKSALSGETNNNRAGTTFWQIRRATWLVHRMLQFKDNVTTV